MKEALEKVLKLSGEVCNAIGKPAVNSGLTPEFRTMIGELEDALYEYDTLVEDHPALRDAIEGRR
jgi:hypothetical protein